MAIASRRIGIFICTTSISLAAVSLPMGCASTYYSIWEKLGYEKRDILVSRVEAAAESQTKAKEQFKTTLDQFKELTGYNGGDLEAEYKKLSDNYDKCKDRAATVSDKINSVDKVATAMFAEWTSELDQYHDPNLRASSEQKLNDSKAKYAHLLEVMRTSERKMQPVLDAFHDTVLTLKHDLNAAAISSLQGTSVDISNNVQSLIQDMDASINEANSFIDNMKKT
jgi:hypothetical protein